MYESKYRDDMRGEIWNVDLSGAVGSEQAGTRPCIIISNNKGNLHAPTVVVLAITTGDRHFGVTHLDVDLKLPSKILCEQIFTRDKLRLKRRLYKLDNETMRKLDEKLMLTLGL